MGSLQCCNMLCVFSNKVFIHSRYLNTSTQLAVKNPLSKQGDMFNKLLGGSSKKKRKFIFDEGLAPSSGNKPSLGQHVKINKENSRRIAVLNTLFMKHISDLLVTGNIGADVLSKGLEISRVSMNPNFNQLNVFWGCNSEKNIDELENILPAIGYTIRHELSQLKVIGIVPRILFIKDKNFCNGAKVDYLLRIADFGEDHVPLELQSDFKSDSEMISVKKKSLNDKEASDETSTLEDEEVMPAMRHDIFNLDHERIMNKILKRILKSKAIHRFEPNLMIKSDGNSITASNIPDTEIMTKEERKNALAKFVLTQRILQEKKMQRKHKSDIDIYEEELENDEVEDEDFEVEDYFDEDFEEKNFKN